MRQIRLTQGKVALVDDNDFEWLSKWKWYFLKGYAVRNIGKRPRKRQYMHRLIINVPQEMQTDHINRNGLDNRRENLRICTQMQNNQNCKPHKNSSSIFKGVHWSKWTRKWMASIMQDYKNMYLGYYDSEIEAAKTYDRKAKELFGKFARTNFG